MNDMFVEHVLVRLFEVLQIAVPIGRIICLDEYKLLHLVQE